MATANYTVLNFILLLLSIFNNNVESYHAVVVIHGVLTGSDSMELISNRIQEMHPGTQIYNTPRYAGWSSLESMWRQVEEIGMDVISVGAAFPQAGQYGTRFLHLFFPDLVCETAYQLFYSKIGQHTSIGNYWNDPHHQKLYYKYSNFLPYVNNEKNSTKMSAFKEGLTKLKRMILVGGPEDGVITPWQSSHFGYYDVNETVINMRDRSIYKDDLIGLKTLDESGRLVLITVPNVPHYEWHKNISIVDDFLLPYLD
ncbi:lysosomal thioesterase PPT2 homolog isoform X2 [Apis dorsata]|uniref:lysosomal thioesterase PPT2 homolog isoform X2 n=1 Tax=Apis dorsata TaxID=7462 RepID=UPI0003DF60ED|nr:lysosomal thioesterase PPT2 homolog isoform X2 [Apis dorsata]